MPPDSDRPAVVLLHDEHAAGARIDTSDVLAEARHVAAALERRGYRTHTLPVGLDLGALERGIARSSPVAAFNLVESLAGRAELIHFVPGLLEAARVPFTGCGAEAQYTTSNKLLAKRRLKEARIAAPEIFVSGCGDRGPWIVKSVWEHASLGIDDASVVTGAHDTERMLARRREELGGDWFAERFIAGRELNVALLAAAGGVTTLPVAEIRFDEFPSGKPRIVGYAAKWHAGSFEHAATRRSFDVEPALAERVAVVARACWDLFGLAGYARVDFRVDEHGALWVLEINSNPCLSPDAGFAAALARAGIEFDDAVSSLLDDALLRRTARASAAADDARPAEGPQGHVQHS